MYPFTLLLYELMTECFEHFADKLNCKIIPSTSEADYDKFIQNIEVFASQGNTDGFIVVIDAILPAHQEVLMSRHPYVAWLTPSATKRSEISPVSVWLSTRPRRQRFSGCMTTARPTGVTTSIIRKSP
jgi:hypothetical protein